MEHYPITAFLGLDTGVTLPPGNSAKDLENVVRHRELGQLEQGDGYSLKFPDNLSDLPQTTNPAADNYFDPAIYRITNLVWENIHNFFVPDHGGRYISVAVGTYRKHAFFPGNPVVDRFGIWIRPWYDARQALWSDEGGFVGQKWLEVTEENIFGAIVEAVSDHSGIDEASVFNSDNTGGNTPWTNPGNAQHDDNIYSTVDLPDHTFASEYLLAEGVGWSNPPPPEATPILIGVEAFVKRKASLANEAKDLSVQFSTFLGYTGDEIANPNDWSIGDEVITYGSPTYTDGGALDWDNVNDPAFGLGVLVQNLLDNDVLCSIDYIKFRRYYTFTDDTRIYVDDGVQYDFPSIDPTGKVFNDTYFLNQLIVVNRGGNDFWGTIYECGYAGIGYFFRVHEWVLGPTPVNGEKLRVFRSQHPFYRHLGDLPSSIQSYIYPLLNEIRLTTGGLDTDVALRVAFRTKTWNLNTHNLSFPYPERTLDRFIVEASGMELNPDMLVDFSGTAVAGATDMLAGHYKVALTLVDDLDNESSVLGSFELDLDGAHYIGTGNITLNWPLVPKFARRFRLYLEKDGSGLFLAQELGLYDGETEITIDTVIDPRHAHLAFTINSPTTETEISVQIDRSQLDNGVARYKFGLVANKRSYLVGVRSQGADYPNFVFTSGFTADGFPEYDEIPNDQKFPVREGAVHLLDVEYNDGDRVIAVGPLDDRVLALKQRSLVLLSPTTQGGYDRLPITKNVGIASARSLVGWDNALYWVDYNGIYKYSTAGPELINAQFLQAWRDISNADKEAAIGVVDIPNRQWRIAVAGKEYIYEFDTGNWVIGRLFNQPQRYAFDNQNPGRVDILSGSELFTLNSDRTIQLHNGHSVDYFWESNRIELPDVGPAGDVKLVYCYVDYESDVDLAIEMFVNDSPVPTRSPKVLSHLKTQGKIFAPLHGRGQAFRLRISWTIEENGKRVAVPRMGAYYQILPATADILSR